MRVMDVVTMLRCEGCLSLATVVYGWEETLFVVYLYDHCDNYKNLDLIPTS